MASKYFKAFNFFKKKGTVAPTITQPRQLPGTMKKIRSQYEKFGFDKAKTAKDRANIVRKRKSIERMDKLSAAKAKRKEGIKGSKEVKKMVDTGQATRVGGQVFHKSVREKKFFGGRVEKYSKNNFTLSMASGSSLMTAQASTTIGALNIINTNSSFQSDCLASRSLPW